MLPDEFRKTPKVIRQIYKRKIPSGLLLALPLMNSVSESWDVGGQEGAGASPRASWASLWLKLVHLFFGWPHPALPGTFGHIAQHEAEQRVAFPQGSTGISVRHWLSFRARRKAGLHDGVSDCCIHKKDLCSC